MSDVEDRRPEPADDGEAAEAGRSERARAKLGAAKESVQGASERHVALAVPIRAVERNRRVAASVLAGGLAYRLFLWLLPFGLIVGGALGLSNANDTEDAVDGGGVPAAISNAIGDASRAANSNSWWLLAVGVPLLLWTGFTGAKAVVLVHSLVWDEPPPKPKPVGSLVFTGMVCAAIITVALSSWFADVAWHGLLAAALPDLRGWREFRPAHRAVALGLTSPSAQGRSLAGAPARRTPHRDRSPSPQRTGRRLPHG